jgi:hypothetical protein
MLADSSIAAGPVDGSALQRLLAHAQRALADGLEAMERSVTRDGALLEAGR